MLVSRGGTVTVGLLRVARGGSGADLCFGGGGVLRCRGVVQPRTIADGPKSAGGLLLQSWPILASPTHTAKWSSVSIFIRVVDGHFGFCELPVRGGRETNIGSQSTNVVWKQQFAVWLPILAARPCLV